MRVYRLEDKEGNGPYTSRMLRKQDKERLLYNIYAPSCGARDDIQGFGLKHVCGFVSIKSMVAWFGNDELGELISLGMSIVEYKLPKEAVLHSKSGRQVAFRKDSICPNRK